MEGTENSKATIVKKPKRRVLKIIIWALVVIILVLVLGVAFGAPAYVSSGSFRKMILAKVNAGGAGEVDFADLTMSWGKGISISKISYKDDEGGLSVAVKGVSTKPRYGALMGGNLSLGETIVDEPRVEIDVSKMKQKTEDRGQKTEGGGQKEETKTGAGLPIGRIDLVVKNGDVKIKGERGEVEVSQINSSVDLRPEGEETKFDIGAKVVENNTVSTIKGKGEVKPGKGWDLKKTSGDVAVEVNNLDLGSLESILAIAGVDVTAKGVISGDIKGVMKEGKIETASGVVKGKGLEITAPGLKGDKIKTDTLEADVTVRRVKDLMNVEKLTVQTDWLKADANGTAPMSLATLEDFLKPDSKYELRADIECDIPAIAAQLPATLGLKEGMRITGGKLACNVETLSEAGVKKLSGQISVDGLAGSFKGKPISVPEPIRAAALITTQGKEIKFEKADLTSSFANVNCSGTVSAFSYDAQANLAKLSNEIGQFADISRYKLAGQVSSRGKISNNENTTMIVSSATIDNLRASPTTDITISEPNASIDVIAALDKKENVLLVKQFKAGTSLGQFSVKDGKIPMSKESKEALSLTAVARDVDLSRVQPYLVMAKAISKDVQLSGTAESDMTVGIKEGNYKVSTESTKITNLLVKAPGKQPFMQETVAIVFNADINPATSDWSADMEVTGTNIKIKGNFKQNSEGQTSNLQGNAQLDYDWKVLSGILSAFMPSGLVVEGKRKDTVNFSSRYQTAGKTDAMLANLDAQAKVGFDKAEYMGLNIGATSVDIKVEKGFLTMAPFTTTVNTGVINFGGSADFKKKPAMFKTAGPMNIIKDVQLNVEIANKLLARVNPLFGGTSSITGTASLQCDSLAVPISGGREEDVNIAGTISLTNVKMQPTGLLGAILTASGAAGGQLMMFHPTPFTVKGGFVRYTNMQMDIGNMPVNFGGIVPLDPDRKIENFSVTLPVSSAGKIVKAPTGKETGAEPAPERITAYIKGTPRKPELDIGRMVQEELINTGLQILTEKSKKK